MEPEQVFVMVGQIYLAQWGNNEKAANIVGELAEFRARRRDQGAQPNIRDFRNVLSKLCDVWGNKPFDWQAFMADLRPRLLAHPEGPTIAKDIFTGEFIDLPFSQTVVLFRDRLNFFAPDGTFPVINNAEAEKLGVIAPHGGKTFFPLQG
jgi:hypothetical protein